MLSSLDHLARVGGQLGRVGIFERVLELRPADAIFHSQVLQRLQKELDAVDVLLPWPAGGWITSVADILRSSSGFRLIWMRPELSVVLVPSTPMKEETLSTAGILQNDVHQLLLALGHAGESSPSAALR